MIVWINKFIILSLSARNKLAKAPALNMVKGKYFFLYMTCPKIMEVEKKERYKNGLKKNYLKILYNVNVLN